MIDITDELQSRLSLRRAGSWWRGRCPSCGNEALSIRAGRAGIRAVCFYGCDRADLHGPLDLGALPPAEAAADDAREKAIGVARCIWKGADPVRADDPAGRYLARRRLGAALSFAALRYRRDTPHPSGGRWPALICRVDNPAGEMVAVHRIFLTLDGQKAKIDPVKAAKGPLWTGAIRFGTGPKIVVAEGPETTIAAGIILNLPAWSAISAGNLARALVLPSAVREVTIAADHDASGIAAAEGAAARWQAEGRDVRIIKPNQAGYDFADILDAEASR